MGIAIANIVEEGKILVKGKDASKLYGEGYGYILGDTLELSDVEAVYLAFRKTIKVLHKGREISIAQLFKLLEENNPELPLVFTVYQDLRSRGRIVKPGFRRNVLFLYTKGVRGPADKVVYVVGEESTEFTMNELLKWINEAFKINKVPIIAIVDKHGDVTYYEVKHVELKKREELYM